VKPKIFIGSSVEGLSVAYAIQQNLTHDAEPTVWDQGIFDLSQTSIESLTKTVDDSDFGIFVFSPDDIVKMRGKESKAIRDNVIFEFGLFIGRLGRDRVFFVTPEGSDFHLPTDLLGITPGVYNPNREDGRLQAATGPACNQIREAVKKIPLLSSTISKDESDESSDVNSSSQTEWLTDLMNDEYDDARKKLKLEMENKTGDDLIEDKSWMAFIDFKEDEVKGLDKLLDIVNTNLDSIKIVSLISTMFSWENYYDQALEIVERSSVKIENSSELLVLKSEFMEGIGDKEEAKKLLTESDLITTPDVAIALSEKYEDDELDKAIETIHAAYSKYPNNKKVMFKYSRLLQEADCHKEAFYLLNYLCVNNPKETKYFGYLSNTCLKLNFYDKAMTSLKKAVELSKESEPWLLHNVGNLLSNKGFYSEAEEWLNKGLKLEPSSEYAHDRLAKAIKKRSEDNEKFSDIKKEGRSLIRKRNNLES
jgi:tetratricopeptide (TPR) repeat protein